MSAQDPINKVLNKVRSIFKLEGKSGFKMSIEQAKYLRTKDEEKDKNVEPNSKEHEVYCRGAIVRDLEKSGYFDAKGSKKDEILQKTWNDKLDNEKRTGIHKGLIHIEHSLGAELTKGLSKEAHKRLLIENADQTMEFLRDTHYKGQNISYLISIHDETDVLHAHINIYTYTDKGEYIALNAQRMYGDNEQVKAKKEQALNRQINTKGLILKLDDNKDLIKKTIIDLDKYFDSHETKGEQHRENIIKNRVLTNMKKKYKGLEIKNINHHEVAEVIRDIRKELSFEKIAVSQEAIKYITQNKELPSEVKTVFKAAEERKRKDSLVPGIALKSEVDNQRSQPIPKTKKTVGIGQQAVGQIEQQPDEINKKKIRSVREVLRDDKKQFSKLIGDLDWAKKGELFNSDKAHNIRSKAIRNYIYSQTGGDKSVYRKDDFLFNLKINTAISDARRDFDTKNKAYIEKTNKHIEKYYETIAEKYISTKQFIIKNEPNKEIKGRALMASIVKKRVFAEQGGDKGVYDYLKGDRFNQLIDKTLNSAEAHQKREIKTHSKEAKEYVLENEEALKEKYAQTREYYIEIGESGFDTEKAIKNKIINGLQAQKSNELSYKELSKYLTGSEFNKISKHLLKDIEKEKVKNTNELIGKISGTKDKVAELMDVKMVSVIERAKLYNKIIEDTSNTNNIDRSAVKKCLKEIHDEKRENALPSEKTINPQTQEIASKFNFSVKKSPKRNPELVDKLYEMKVFSDNHAEGKNLAMENQRTQQQRLEEEQTRQQAREREQQKQGMERTLERIL